MAAIRSKDTKPEVYLRKLLFSKGYRYRKNVTNIYGHPDLWLAKYNTAIFIHGCFWHRHQGCQYAYLPKTNIVFWKTKFQKNVERDKKVLTELNKENIRVIVIWECTIKKMMRDDNVREQVTKTVDSFLNGEIMYLEV